MGTQGHHSQGTVDPGYHRQETWALRGIIVRGLGSQGIIDRRHRDSGAL